MAKNKTPPKKFILANLSLAAAAKLAAESMRRLGEALERHKDMKEAHANERNR